MSYLLDKKIKQKRLIRIALCVVALFFLFFFRTEVSRGLSSVSQGIFRPVLVAGNGIGAKFKSLGAYFVSKNSLYRHNQELQAKLDFDEARMTNYDSFVADASALREVLGRKNEKVSMVLGAILQKPNQSPYDTLLIDIGTEEGVNTGNTVFALGDVPVGRIAEAYERCSKVILFSSAGEKTMVFVSSQGPSMELLGRGGGNFEMILPKDITLQKGDQAVLPGLSPYVVAIAETIISDPRDPFTKALLTSPVNIQAMKFVEVAL